MIPAFKFGGNSSNWAWYKTADGTWTADVLGQIHRKVDGKYVVDPDFHIRIWKNNADGGHDYNNPDYDFRYKPKTIPVTGDKLSERTLNKVVREHLSTPTPRAPEGSGTVSVKPRLRRPGIATRRVQPDLWNVYHPTNDHVRFGHVNKATTGWRAYDVKGRELDGHRLMSRTQAAQTVADAYKARQ